MIYEYACWDCSKSQDRREDYFILQIEHKMSETPKFTCPVCGGDNVEKIISVPSAVYVKGDGYLDKKGVRRDMDRYTLKNKDPYAHMREPGEAEDLDQKLKNQGKFNEGKTTPKEIEAAPESGIQGEWDPEQNKVIWKEKKEEKEKDEGPESQIPSWLPRVP
jgi:putative FmdB family regulatory protein